MLRSEEVSLLQTALEAAGLDVMAATSLGEALHEALDKDGYAIYRRRINRNGVRPKRSQRMTDQIRAEIVKAFERNPDMTQSQIASMFNVNPGRVAEALGSVAR